MNEDQMQQDSDVRVQHLEIFREFIWFLVYKEAGDVARSHVDDAPMKFPNPSAFYTLS